MFVCVVVVYIDSTNRQEISGRFEPHSISGAEQIFLFLFITCHINCYNKNKLYINN